MSRTVVIGLGNVVMSDDGLGVHALGALRERDGLPDGVELVEGGTAGLLLLPYLEDADHAVIIDAIDVGAAPGTPVRLDGDDWDALASLRLSPHQVGVADLLAAARISGAWPAKLVLLGAQPGHVGIGTELSAAVAGSLPAVVDAVAAELEELGELGELACA